MVTPEERDAAAKGANDQLDDVCPAKDGPSPVGRQEGAEEFRAAVGMSVHEGIYTAQGKAQGKCLGHSFHDWHSEVATAGTLLVPSELAFRGRAGGTHEEELLDGVGEAVGEVGRKAAVETHFEEVKLGQPVRQGPQEIFQGIHAWYVSCGI